MVVDGSSAKLAPLLDPEAALRWLQRAPAGATALVVTTARGSAVRATPAPDAMRRLHSALDAARAAGATRALLWQLEGLAREGEPVAIAGAVADHRREALAAVDALLSGLQGVATREDA
jgi:hypothetical protein